MIADGNRSLHEASLPAVRRRQTPVRRRQTPPPVVHGTDEYVAAVWQTSGNHLADLNAQARTARNRETVLWSLFVLIFILTLAAGGAGVVLIFLASLKVAIASGAAGVIPGCTSALLKRECTTQSKNRQAIEAKRDEHLRLYQGAAAIAELPPGPQKEKLQVDYARKMLSRVPK